MTEEEKKAEIAKASVYQNYLSELFTDFSFSELKSGITKDNLQTNANYQNLSPALQSMVNKIADKNWAEGYSGLNLKVKYPKLIEEEWDGSYAFKYRVQLYEPYSDGSTASDFVGVSKYTNMNNPTGIVGDKGDLIYVMVNDEISEGATLYINEVYDPNTMYNGTQQGTKLHRGLNIFECKNDNYHFFIYYTVQTVKQSNGKYIRDESHKLSNYKPIKIHIEGGRVNGFFNYVGDALYEGDKEEDFDYTVQRATHPMYNLIGKHVILHFHLEDTPGDTNPGTAASPCVKTVLYTNKKNKRDPDKEYDPAVILAAWDDMCLSERILMGLQSDDDVNDSFNKGLYEPNSEEYSITVGGKTYKSGQGFEYNEYFNNKLFGMSRQAEGLFMSAGDWRTSYNVNTIDAVLTLFTKGDIWGPAHEYGHMNQRLINMAGTTEESNNIFSNIAVYYRGEHTSRSDFISNQLKIFLEGKPFLENGTWGTTRMFWQLWCYYHVIGHNKKFYPRLFELLRNDPLVKTTRPGKHNERYDKLHFAKMCCIAAEEDLTDFFTAWGFFVPMELYSFADYNTYDTYLTEEDIKAVKDEIASFGFKKNDAIILIDDRVGSTRDSYSGFPKENAGDYGGFSAFKEDRAPQGTFSFTVDIDQVKITADGDPGAGFIIRDSEGNLIGFSNSKTFEVNDEVAEKLRSGEAKIQAVGTNGKESEVENTILSGSPETKKKILQDMLSKCETLLKSKDPTLTKVGFITPDGAQPLEAVMAEVRTAISEDATSSEQLSELIGKLSKEYTALIENEDAFIKLVSGNLYILNNSYRSTTQLLSNDKSVVTIVNRPSDVKKEEIVQWYFEPTGSNDIYYIKNWGNKYYIQTGNSGVVPVGVDNPTPYELISQRKKDAGIGLFSLAPQGHHNLALHVNGRVLPWDASSGASQWYITKVKDSSELDLSEVYKSQIQAILNKYKELESEIDPEGVNVGYLKPEVQNIIDKNCAFIKAVINEDNYTSDQYKAFYEEQMDLFNRLRDSENRIMIESGAAYMIRNVEDGSRIMYTSDGNNLGTSEMANSKKFEAQWVFEDGKTPGSFVIRNLSNDKFISKVNQSNTKIPLKEEGAEFTLVDYPEEIGHYGIIADGSVSNALINSIISEGNIDYKMVIMTFLSNDAGKWNIIQVRDKEYVSLRDRLGELIEKAKEIIQDYDSPYYFAPEWLDTYFLVEDLTAGDSPYKNPETEKEELQNWVDELDSNLTYADAINNGDEIITVESIGSFNDGVDNDDSETGGIIRHAFNISESISFEGIISIPNLDNPSNVIVTVEPVKNGQWLSTDATDATSLMNEYADVFNKTAPGSGLLDQLKSLKCDYVDGFFTSVSGELKESEKESHFDLVLHVPCSGLYRVTLRGKDGYALFDENKKIPIFEIEVYPNLKGTFNKDKGLNIEGYTFDDDEECDKTIYLPKDAIARMNLSRCIIYIPGLYFVDEFNAWLDSESDESNKETPIRLNKSKVNSTTSAPGASKYFCPIDLSCLKDMDERSPKKQLTVSVSKNGATANYTFYVAVGENGNVSTNVETIETIEGEEPVYYNLQGVRVINPQHGIYIRRIGNKTEKVIL